MASTGEPWRLGHRPALDGLRGVAILLVLAAHAHVPGVETAGPVGVTVFFTLSGFLITRLLLEEYDRNERLSLRGFYGRRVRRLFPALFACVIAVAAAGALVPGLVPMVGVVAAATHLMDWALVLAPSHYLGALSHTWSLAVEEQFYLVWPLLLAAVACRRRAVLALCAAGTLMSVVARFVLWNGGTGQWRVYFGADTHADGLLIGCGLAVAMTTCAPRRPGPGVSVVALCLIVLCSFTVGAWAGLGVPLVVPWLTALVIWASVEGSRLLSWKPLRVVGLRSYGLYLWHYPVSILVWLWFGGAWLHQVVIMLPVSAVLTILSWRFIEAPFQRARVSSRLSQPSEMSSLATVGAHSAVVP